jgi:hypothetical protein
VSDEHSLSNFALGGAINGGEIDPTTLFSGDVAEVLAFDYALTRSEMAHVQSYLIDKYGLLGSAAPIFGGSTMQVSFS